MDNKQTNQPFEGRLKLIDWILLTVVLVVLAAVSFMLANNLKAQNTVYDHVIAHADSLATRDSSYFDDGNAAVLAFARSRDFANMKAAGMFIGFLLLFTGALYLLKVFNLSYKLNADNTPAGSISLESTSPGLIMITLGTALIIVALVTKTSVDYNVKTTGIDPVAMQKALTALAAVQNDQGETPGAQSTTKPNKRGQKQTATTPPLPEIADGTFLTSDMKTSVNDPVNQTKFQSLANALKADPTKKVLLRATNAGSAKDFHKARQLALAIQNLLLAMGVPSKQISVVAFGATPPVVGNAPSGITIQVK